MSEWKQKHHCAKCGRGDVRLYRWYGSFLLRDDEIFCRAHAEAGVIDKQYMVLLVEDDDGSVWGYTSCPAAHIERTMALPEAV